jgi:cell division septal protein FtsQ
VTARKRVPFAQTSVKEAILILDDHGIVLSSSSQQNNKLPLVEGLALRGSDFTLGLPLKGREVKVGLQVLRSFQNNRSLTGYDIKSIDVSNLSKVSMILSNDLKIFVDWDNIDHKMKVLSLVMAQSQLDFKQIKYLDLRFKEPIIGKK